MRSTRATSTRGSRSSPALVQALERALEAREILLEVEPLRVLLAQDGVLALQPPGVLAGRRPRPPRWRPWPTPRGGGSAAGTFANQAKASATGRSSGRDALGREHGQREEHDQHRAPGMTTANPHRLQFSLHLGRPLRTPVDAAASTASVRRHAFRSACTRPPPPGEGTRPPRVGGQSVLTPNPLYSTRLAALRQAGRLASAARNPRRRPNRAPGPGRSGIRQCAARRTRRCVPNPRYLPRRSGTLPDRDGSRHPTRRSAQPPGGTMAKLLEWLIGKFSIDMGIDLGTANTLVCVQGRGHHPQRALRRGRQEGHQQGAPRGPRRRRHGQGDARQDARATSSPSVR